MTPESVILGLIVAFLLCLSCGLAYAYAAGDSKRRKRKTIGVALGSGALGWIFAMFLPIKEFKATGVDFISLFCAIYGSHIYWFIFKPKSKTTRLIDVNGRG